jgi:hypothetical protein
MIFLFFSKQEQWTASVLVIISPQLLGGSLFGGDYPFPYLHDVGFEPTKLTQQILSLSPLTARETVLLQHIYIIII